VVQAKHYKITVFGGSIKEEKSSVHLKGIANYLSPVLIEANSLNKVIEWPYLFT